MALNFDDTDSINETYEIPSLFIRKTQSEVCFMKEPEVQPYSRRNFAMNLQKKLIEEERETVVSRSVKQASPEKVFCKRLSFFEEENEYDSYSPNTQSTRSTLSSNSLFSRHQEESHINPFDSDENSNPNIYSGFQNRGFNRNLSVSSLNLFKVKNCSQSSSTLDMGLMRNRSESSPTHPESGAYAASPSLNTFSPNLHNLSLAKSKSTFASAFSFACLEPSTAASVMDIECEGLSPVPQSPSLGIAEEEIFEEKKPLLPSFKNAKNNTINTITAETMNELLTTNVNNHRFLVIDCRYAYEHKGGHIKGAINITDPLVLERLLVNNHALLYKESYIKSLKENFESVLNSFVTIKNYENEPTLSSPPIIIFHCEFSIERGPRMLNHLRKIDRDLNMHRYPVLNYPEIYLLGDGYSKFYVGSPKCCQPEGAYVAMKDSRFKQDLSDADRRDGQYWNRKTNNARTSNFNGRAISQIIY